ncbi:helix-turn-helix domain-containing protein [Kitasatospora sp. NPDC094028]
MGVETDEFAAMLRELKDRSGRSYGALATRLHVSTSTLHRYCNGAAVPAEYAPVERFARACGADGPELVELHRRWILADAARRREPGAVAVAPRPEAVPEPQPQSEPEAEAEAEVEDAPGPVAAPRRPRRPSARVLASVAAVVVVAVVSALLLRGNGRPAVETAAATASATATAAGPTAEPVGGSTPASAPASAPAPAPASAPASVSASAPVATPEAPPAPFHVNVLSNNWGTPCGQWFLTPRAPGKVSLPPKNQAATEGWAASQGGVPAGHLRLQLTAQGTSAKAVALQAVYVHVVDSRPAPKGNAYMPGSGCGGGIDPAFFNVDLDAPAPRTVAVAGEKDNGKVGPSDFPFHVSDTDLQVLRIDATTRSQDVSWYLEIEWNSDGHQGTVRVPDNNQVFRTVATTGAPGYFYDGKGWAPTPVDP